MCAVSERAWVAWGQLFICALKEGRSHQPSLLTLSRLSFECRVGERGMGGLGAALHRQQERSRT